MMYVNLCAIFASMLFLKGNSVRVTTQLLPTPEPENSYNDWVTLIKHNLTSFMKLYSHGNKKYYINFNLKASYFEASQFCEDINMNLVSIQNGEENNALTKYIRDANQGDVFWTSGNKFIDGNHWIWMSTFQVTEYTNWAKGEPNGPLEYCIELRHIKNAGLFWYDRDCNTKSNFICEKEINENYVYDDSRNKKHFGKIFQDTYITPNIALLNFDDKSYFVGRYYKATFLEAVQLCKMIKMQLVTIESTNENSRLHKYIRDTNAGEKFWSSGTKLIDGKTWVWIAKARPVEYTNWGTNEPDNMNHLCIQLVNKKDDGLFWNDFDCNDRNFYICEKPNYYYRPPGDASMQDDGLDVTISPRFINLFDGAKLRGRGVTQNSPVDTN